ncbi:DNA polymerase-3 subunit delta' [Meinhardsimonia xiamenensis]|jgi:DNA polymerase-3 subunit delta'|uniref:DNA polymerase-3 subunit delta n=1 Tax=Meinhardsimonia xiamenensis TaxID=990712 RepID=A0A1G9AG80_9RHOB|nr:DNA polymerase III subunit delta' [Meinhardsimonia xiamenensis]PRX35423.1 DNA polymerase-3 subunit delta' [Meinhardsimonia xiamenensis]SDK25560.1 DNA polymerase-3 subunit delta' [Meinhardsimonia xiamenensis]
MSDVADIPEADRVEGAPHPRQTRALFGQEAAEREFLEALAGGRLHHGWLITGPRGVGKATLAWRIARRLLSEAPAEAAGQGLFGEELPPAAAKLDAPADPALEARIAALSEPRLCLIRRSWDPARKRLRTVITVDDVRRLRGFFALSAAEGGRRVVIVDSADEMNVNAANAILKVLEEPPRDTVLLLVSHQPARLLPTIRSRCRVLRCAPLGAEDMGRALAAAGIEAGTDTPALAELSGGSVGEALRILAHDGLALYAELLALMATMPRLDRAAAVKFAESAGARGEAERLDLAIELIELALARLARAAVAGPPAIEAAPGEADTLTRLAAVPGAGRLWAELQQSLGARMRHGRAVNLDPASLILDTVLRINDAAAGLSR